MFCFVLASAGVFALGQSSTPQATASKATVYIYRYKQFVGSALAPSVFCDQAQLARMENGRYFSVKVDPGSHAFRSNDEQSGVVLDAQPGQDYFIRVEIAAGMLKGHGRLTLTAPEQGRYELQSSKLKPLDADKVVDHERVSVEEAKFEAAVKASTSTSSQPAPKVSAAPPTSNEEPVREVTLSDQAASDTQTSLADASRQARQKKAAASNTSSPQ
jgi:hypothetical protein